MKNLIRNGELIRKIDLKSFFFIGLGIEQYSGDCSNDKTT
jgi:hypothetical protein